MLKEKDIKRILRKYVYSPSAVLMRCAEVDLLSEQRFRGPILDLCCGDGFIASLLDVSFDAGCDWSDVEVRNALQSGVYRDVKKADITQVLPYDKESFNTVVSNSALEHVKDINTALMNIRDVLKPGGKLIFTLASDMAYKWWPCSKEAKQEYFRIQPVYNYFSLEEWKERLGVSGMRYISHQYYLDRFMSRVMFFIDYYHSMVILNCKKGPAGFIVKVLKRFPESFLRFLWSVLLVRRTYRQKDTGGGILIVAEKI